ncbi:unnamed protein product [Ilex paraguariensis]|uniref:MATH domain-containing protein n=1 Tax=Ilex paraguariensis TaxID=185542 RepID=A0ABC8USK3_9AQUA
MTRDDLHDSRKGYMLKDKVIIEAEILEADVSVLVRKIFTETVCVPEQPVTGTEASQPQQSKDKQVAGCEKVPRAKKEGEAAANVKAAIGKAQAVETMSFSIQGIPEVQIPDEVPYDGPGNGSDLVQWLNFMVQRRCVAYLNKLVERYPDSLAHFSSRSPLVQAGHLGTLALLLYTADTIPVRAWSNALHERFLSYIEDLKEAHVELPWIVERFALLLGLRVRYLAKIEMEDGELEAEKLRQESAVLQAKLGVLEEKIAVTKATMEAKEHLLSGVSFDYASDDPILSRLL